MHLNLSESRLAELWDLARSNEAPIETLSIQELMVVKQYRAISASLVAPWQSAPTKVVEIVKAIMPPVSRRFSIGQLVQPRPLLGFARGAVSQIQFEAEEVKVRIQLEEIHGGWRMWGRTSDPGWIVWSGESSAECNEDGEFELNVQTASVEPLSLQNELTTILLPMIFNETGDGNA